MEKHFELTDSQFEQQFRELTLPPALFTHEAHLRLAWIHIKSYGANKAVDTICTQIKAFASFHGDAEKFNTTVTVAAVRAVYHFILKSKSDNFQDFIHEFPQLKEKFRDLLDSHYSFDLFKSELAKKDYIDPDIEPFDKI